MRSLGDEIAVLDGLDAIPPAYSMTGVLDASAGANYSGGSSYAPGLPLLPSNAGLAGYWGDDQDLVNAYSRLNVIDASSGANYSGGSSYAPGLPLLPSNAGLADADDDLRGYGIAAGVLPPRTGVLDASDGGNYSGGSSYAPGLPLLPSNAGLAGTYDGKPLEDMDWYWGSTMGVDNNAYSRTNVLDASAGANYSGGSSYAPGLPLLPSSAGLAGLDAVSDKLFMSKLSPRTGAAFRRMAGAQAIRATKSNALQLSKMLQKPVSREQYDRIKQAYVKCMQTLNKQRGVRAKVVKA
jgi:hypothetical protein